MTTAASPTTAATALTDDSDSNTSAATGTTAATALTGDDAVDSTDGALFDNGVELRLVVPQRSPPTRPSCSSRG